MLQIVTKMYFREGVPLHSTVHRDVLYTNRSFLRADSVELPVGELAPSDRPEAISTATVSVTEHLEAEMPDGTDSMLIATSGSDLIDDLADVLSFGLNSVFTRDHDLSRRLVPSSESEASATPSSKLFSETFEPRHSLLEPEIEKFRHFMTGLLALRRDCFERAMKAIRRIVHATERAADHPTIAYVDIVAALESLSSGANVPAPTWQRLDARKRNLMDEALVGAKPVVAEQVRQATLEAERLGLKSRFVTFVIGNISSEFFREEATAARRPVRGPELERVVKLAYDIRSRNVHVLEDLPPEAWVLGEKAETVSLPSDETALSLEGLSRLARHVVRNFIASAPKGIDRSFDWRASLPGQIKVRPASQYWIWNADGFTQDSAPRYFAGFVEQLASVRAGSSDGVPDMRAVLERIEKIVPGTADGAAKRSMVAIYVLWHALLNPDGHRPGAKTFLEAHEHSLLNPDLISYVTAVLLGKIPDWTADQWYELALRRRAERQKRRYLELPSGFDAGLMVVAADILTEAERTDEAAVLTRFAVEEMPGEEALMAWEAGLVGKRAIEIDIGALAFGLEQPDSEPPATPQPGAPP